MNITITPTKLKGTITPPPSKSQAHRLILAAALAGGESVLSNMAMSQDIQATLGCMQALGAKAALRGDALSITGIGYRRTPCGACMCGIPHLDCGESGSTLRFLIPVALAVAGGASSPGGAVCSPALRNPTPTCLPLKGSFMPKRPRPSLWAVF